MESFWLESVLFVHLAGIAFWIGILSPQLVPAMRNGDASAASLLRRSSVLE